MFPLCGATFQGYLDCRIGHLLNRLYHHVPVQEKILKMIHDLFLANEGFYLSL